MTYEPWPQKKGTKGLAFLVTNCDNEKPKNPKPPPGKDWVPKDFLAGTIHDHDTWMTALTKLNFDVRWERNLDKNLMINFLKTVSSIGLDGCEYVIFVFSGHGGEGVIYAQDGEELSLKDDVFPPFFQGSVAGLKKLFFIDACRQEPADNSPTLTQALFGFGEYYALCPVPYGREAADYSGGSPFSEAVTRYIVEDISLAEVVENVRKSLHARAQKDKVQKELVTEISTLQSSPRLASLCNTGAPQPPIVQPSTPESGSYRNVRAVDVIESLEWDALVQDIKNMLTKARVETLRRSSKLIDDKCVNEIQYLDQDPDSAATTLIKYFEKTHFGDELMTFCKFLRKEAKKAGKAPALVDLAEKIEDAVKRTTSKVLQGFPTDAGLQGVIDHPNIGKSWLDLAIALGVPEAHIDTSSRPLGLSAFQHWRNDKVEEAPPTWEFLLKKVTKTFGPEITEKLEKEIFSHPHWTE